MSINVGDLLKILSKKAPIDLAESWDNVGLIAGDLSAKVKAIVVAVNLGPEALREALKKKANVIICHHPPIFKPTLKLTAQQAPFVYEAIRKNISIISLHTNFDLSSYLLNKKMAFDLGFDFQKPLADREGSRVPFSDKTPQTLLFGKLIIYVPQSHLNAIKQVLSELGAGKIGDYDSCSFSSEGIGSFRPLEGAKPFLGKKGKIETVSESKLEALIPWARREEILKKVRQIHPYEEMAYDLFLVDAFLDKTVGYGWVGKSLKPISAPLLFKRVQKYFELVTPPMLIECFDKKINNNKYLINKMAFSPGSGAAFLSNAQSEKVDLFVTGELGYHSMLEARAKGIPVLLLGHSYSERFFVETVAEWCKPSSQVFKVFEIIHTVL
jgi:dinuclear metal center YbgI/SA1388 family protein